MMRRPPETTPFPYTTLFRSLVANDQESPRMDVARMQPWPRPARNSSPTRISGSVPPAALARTTHWPTCRATRSEEHTSELQSRLHIVCRLLLEKKKGDGPGE